MIEGITILNQTDILTLGTWCVLGIIISSAAAIISFILGLSFADSDVLFGSIISMVILIIILVIGLCNMEPTGRYIYEVTIDESVDFIDIYKNYDVIEQKGQIWVLKDKEK